MTVFSSTYKNLSAIIVMTVFMAFVMLAVPAVVPLNSPYVISAEAEAEAPENSLQEVVKEDFLEEIEKQLSQGELEELSLYQAVALLQVTDREYKIAELELENQRLNYEMNQARTLRTESRYDRLTGELAYLQAQNEFRQRMKAIYIGLIDSYQELNFLAQRISIAERDRDIIIEELEETRQQLEAGYSSRMDLMLKQLEYNQAVFELASQKAELEQKEREFKSRLGLTEMPELTSRLSQVEEIELPRREEVVQEVLASSFGLEVAEINRELAEIERDRARVSDTPELEMSRLNNQVEMAALEIEKTREDTEDHARQQHHLVEQAFRQLELTQDNIEQAEENRRIIREQRQAGLASARVLSQAELEFEQAELSRAEAGLAYLMAYYDLQDLMGQELEVLVDEILAQGEI